MSKDIRTISTKKSDFLLKNWNIYHLHLEKSLKWKPYQNSNLLFFQPKDTVVHLIDVKPHPKGNGWFARELLEIVYDNWPDLLIYRDGVKVESIPDDEIYDITKREIVFLSFKNGCLFPTNLGVATSGDSNMAVREADRVFDNLTIWEKELQDREDELREMIVQNSFLVPPKLYFRLEIENGYFIAYEPFCGVKIKMFQS